MKRFLICTTCVGLLLTLNSINANAAKTKSTPAKKTEQAANDNMQSKEVILFGTLELKEEKDGAGKVKGKAHVITDSKKKDWKLPNSSKVKYSDFEGLKVKAVCMQLGGNLISMKSMEAIDKAAFEAKQAEIKAAAEAKKAAEGKK